MIGWAVFQVRLRDIAAGEQNLAAPRQLNVVRHVLILENLLDNSLEDGRGNLAALVQADGGIENHYDCDLRVVDGSEACERTDIFCF